MPADHRLFRRLPGVLNAARRARLGSDVRGSALVEFGMVAPALFAFLIAIAVTSITFFAQQGLQTAVDAAARKIMTGQTQNASMTQTQFHDAACAALPPYMSCASLIVDAQTAATMSAVDTTTPTITRDNNGNITNSWNYSVGGSGSIVILRLMYIWPLPTGPLGFTINNTTSTQRLLIATSIAKTEPY